MERSGTFRPFPPSPLTAVCHLCTICLTSCFRLLIHKACLPSCVQESSADSAPSHPINPAISNHSTPKVSLYVPLYTGLASTVTHRDRTQILTDGEHQNSRTGFSSVSLQLWSAAGLHIKMSCRLLLCVCVGVRWAVSRSTEAAANTALMADPSVTERQETLSLFSVTGATT